jgi:hypothetical protein
MFEAAEFAYSPFGIMPLNSIEYYEIVFKGYSLVKRERAFRTNKLGMIFEILRAIGIPDEDTYRNALLGEPLFYQCRRISAACLRAI